MNGTRARKLKRQAREVAEAYVKHQAKDEVEAIRMLREGRVKLDTLARALYEGTLKVWPKLSPKERGSYRMRVVE